MSDEQLYVIAVEGEAPQSASLSLEKALRFAKHMSAHEGKRVGVFKLTQTHTFNLRVCPGCGQDEPVCEELP